MLSLDSVRTDTSMDGEAERVSVLKIDAFEGTVSLGRKSLGEFCGASLFRCAYGLTL
jgi:hypothetical protein